MWRKLSEKQQEKYYRKWIKETIKDETELSLKKHIVHHAKEVYKKDPKEWIASMKNLVYAFEIMYKLKSSVALQLKKLDDKYKKNSKRYTPPPKI